MDRRVSGCLLGGAHWVLASFAAAVIAIVSYWVLVLVVPQLVPMPWGGLRGAASLAAFGLAALVLLVWNAAMALWALRVAQRAVADAQSGEFLLASERLRRMRDWEPFLRLLGMGGGSFMRLRVAEAYAYALHGLPDEAARVALDETGSILRPGLARAAAAVAAMAASESGDAAVWEAIRGHVAWAEAHAADTNGLAILASRGYARALALDLDGAARDQAALERAQPGGRGAHALRGAIAMLRGEWDTADAALLAAKAVPMPGASPGAAARLNHPLEAVRLEVCALRGDADGAERLAAALAAEAPVHREARLAGAVALGEAAARQGRSAGVTVALEGIAEIASAWATSRPMSVATAIGRARVLRAAGQGDRALAVLAAAPAAPHLAQRQRLSFLAGECAAATGDTAEAARWFADAAACGSASWLGARAAERARTGS